MKSSNKSYHSTINVNCELKKVFEALTVNISDWWGSTDASTNALNDIFTVSWEEAYYQFKVIQYEPGLKISWYCVDANQVIKGLENVEKEWVGTTIHWEMYQIAQDKISISMTHQGLIPEISCFEFCSSSWDHFLKIALKNYLEN